MIPSEYGSTAPTSAKSSRSEVRDDEPAALVHLRPLERAREQLQLRELDALVDALEDLVHVGARLDELGREPERLRRRVRVLEAAGIGHERDVERLCQLGRQLDSELADDVPEHLARRRRGRIDEVDVAEARVVVVMVDVDRERRRVERRGVGSEPALVGRVDGDERALGRVVRELAAQLLERQKPVLAGQRRRAGQEHEAVLAERRQRELGREQRAERVAVGILVRRDEEAVGAADRLDDRPEVSLRRVWFSGSGSGASSSMSL